RSIVPTPLTTGGVGGQLVLAGTFFDGGGVYRSTDGGTTFTRLSGNGTSGLPDAGVSDVVEDPDVPPTLYAAVPNNGGGAGTEGVYRSFDAGVTWTQTGPLTGLTGNDRILLSVSGVPGEPVYAAVINLNTGGLTAVFRSDTLGATWTSMGAPSPAIFAGDQGIIHGAILADMADPNGVYISGDRQAQPFPNVNGANAFSGNVFRGEFSAGGTTWQNLVDNGNGGGANGTSPHADSRAMAFDANGSIIQGNDGGVFRLANPNNFDTRVWQSVNGNITPTESHSAAYDDVSKVVFSGNQDTGTSIQSAPGSRVWSDLLQGDGGNVAVDDSQAIGAGESIRYTSFNSLGSFNRSVWDASNNFVSGALLGLHITSGQGTGLTLPNFDPDIQFFNPYVLNNVDPSRMLIGTAVLTVGGDNLGLYESLDRGDHLADLSIGVAGLAAFVGNGDGNTPLAYGGRLNGVANPGIFYAAAGATILFRSADGQPITSLSSYPGSTVRALVMDPQTDTHVFVLDTNNNVWGSLNSGTTWINLTANLGTLSPSVRTIQIFSPSPSPLNTVLLVGGQNGVFQLRRPGAAGGSWSAVAAGFPHALVYDLRYDYTDNVLVAGTLGRGVWTLTSFFRGGGGTGTLAVTDPMTPALPLPNTLITPAAALPASSVPPQTSSSPAPAALVPSRHVPDAYFGQLGLGKPAEEPLDPLGDPLAPDQRSGTL
ncbi:MAG TPA: sialidase family protein, partial [Gemmataceae bacterium]|nr:sialidase family protein [Gemmataceae bacterium]